MAKGVGFGAAAVNLLIIRFYVTLGSQMLNILDAHLFSNKLVLQIPIPDVYCVNIRALLCWLA